MAFSDAQAMEYFAMNGDVVERATNNGIVNLDMAWNHWWNYGRHEGRAAPSTWVDPATEAASPLWQQITARTGWTPDTAAAQGEGFKDKVISDFVAVSKNEGAIPVQVSDPVSQGLLSDAKENLAIADKYQPQGYQYPAQFVPQDFPAITPLFDRTYDFGNRPEHWSRGMINVGDIWNRMYNPSGNPPDPDQSLAFVQWGDSPEGRMANARSQYDTPEFRTYLENMGIPFVTAEQYAADKAAGAVGYTWGGLPYGRGTTLIAPNGQRLMYVGGGWDESTGSTPVWRGKIPEGWTPTQWSPQGGADANGWVTNVPSGPGIPHLFSQNTLYDTGLAQEQRLEPRGTFLEEALDASYRWFTPLLPGLLPLIELGTLGATIAESIAPIGTEMTAAAADAGMMGLQSSVHNLLLNQVIAGVVNGTINSAVSGGLRTLASGGDVEDLGKIIAAGALGGAGTAVVPYASQFLQDNFYLDKTLANEIAQTSFDAAGQAILSGGDVDPTQLALNSATRALRNKILPEVSSFIQRELKPNLDTSSSSWAPFRDQFGNMVFDDYPSQYDINSGKANIPAIAQTTDWGIIADFIGMDEDTLLESYSPEDKDRLVELYVAETGKVPVTSGDIDFSRNQALANTGNIEYDEMGNALYVNYGNGVKFFLADDPRMGDLGYYVDAAGNEIDYDPESRVGIDMEGNRFINTTDRGIEAIEEVEGNWGLGMNDNPIPTSFKPPTINFGLSGLLPQQQQTLARSALQGSVGQDKLVHPQFANLGSNVTPQFMDPRTSGTASQLNTNALFPTATGAQQQALGGNIPPYLRNQQPTQLSAFKPPNPLQFMQQYIV